MSDKDKQRIEQAEKEYANNELIPCDEKIKDKFFKDCGKDLKISTINGDGSRTVTISEEVYKQLQASQKEVEELRDVCDKWCNCLQQIANLTNITVGESICDSLPKVKLLIQENTALKEQIKLKDEALMGIAIKSYQLWMDWIANGINNASDNNTQGLLQDLGNVTRLINDMTGTTDSTLAYYTQKPSNLLRR